MRNHETPVRLPALLLALTLAGCAGQGGAANGPDAPARIRPGGCGGSDAGPLPAAAPAGGLERYRLVQPRIFH